MGKWGVGKIHVWNCFSEKPKFQYQNFNLHGRIILAMPMSKWPLTWVNRNKQNKEHMVNITSGIVNFQNICIANLKKFNKAVKTNGPQPFLAPWASAPIRILCLTIWGGTEVVHGPGVGDSWSKQFIIGKRQLRLKNVLNGFNWNLNLTDIQSATGNKSLHMGNKGLTDLLMHRLLLFAYNDSIKVEEGMWSCVYVYM